jgi:type IV pilus assembly protein PilQ
MGRYPIAYFRSQKSEVRSQKIEEKRAKIEVQFLSLFYLPFSIFIVLSSIVCLLTSALCPFTSVYAQEDIIPIVKFKDADIKIVLQSIAQKATKDGKKVNIVISPKVEGLISIDLENVDWQTALKGVLSAYGYGYKWVSGNIILVATYDEIKEKDVQDKERQEIEVPSIKVFRLTYIDANDAKLAIQSLLSPLGKVTVLESTGQAGWEFGEDLTKRKRSKEGQVSRTKVLVVSDVSKNLEEIDKLIKEIDLPPKQILIKTRIMEVDRTLLRDFGFDWGTGSTGAGTAGFDQLNLGPKNTKTLGSHSIYTTTPTIYPTGTTITTSNTGFKADFRILTGEKLQVIMHALEDDTRANTLSAPVILTLNNQEASILVGQKYPIIKTEVSTQTGQVTGGSLDKYQDIGIQLNVVPQICGDKDEFINMIIHPIVSSKSGDLSVKATSSDTPIVSYPILETREAETQIVIQDGDTIVMGGLLKDVKKKEKIGIPILSNLPLIGAAFKRDIYYIDKIDLLIFITAHIIKPGDVVSQEKIDTTSVTSKFKK